MKLKMRDTALLILAALPIAGGMALKVLTAPPAGDMEITGAQVYFTLNTPIQPLPITETQVNSWIVLLSLFWICLFLTRGMTPRGTGTRQLIAEWIVEQTEKLVEQNMGPFFMNFAPFIGAVLALSAFSSLLSLVGLFPPTSDINTTAGWALVVALLITWYKLKCGFGYYVKSFCEPTPVMFPMNIVSEIATPFSMAFRHYGNILSGTVISALLASALQGLSRALLGWLPGGLGRIPFLQIGIPAVLSIYFDLFSGALQAFIFAMLTMLYVAGGFSEEVYEARKSRRKAEVRETAEQNA